MDAPLHVSAETRTTAGLILLTIVTLESGGLLLLRVRHALSHDLVAPGVRQGWACPRWRARDAGLVGQILADEAELSGLLAVIARNGIRVAAILMPDGFFLSSAGRDVTAPNRLIAPVYAGAVSLALGVVSLGIGLLSA